MNQPDQGAMSAPEIKYADELVGFASCGFAVARADGQLLFVNEQLCEWVDAKPEDLVGGRKLQELLSKAGQIYFEAHIRPTLHLEGEVSEVLTQIRGQDGVMRSIFLNATLKSVEGRSPMIYATMLDGSDRVRYERELRASRDAAQRYEVVLRASPDAIVVVDRRRRIAAWNKAAEALFGFTEADAIGREGIELRHGRRLEPFERENLRRVEDGEMRIWEGVRLHKDGREIPVEIHAAPIFSPDGAVEATVRIMRDITQRREDAARMKSVMQEMKHRTKNILAVVQVVAKQTALHTSTRDFLRVFNGRLGSLARNQELLVQSEGRAAEMRELVTNQISHLGEAGRSAITISGEDMTITGRAAEAIGMAIYELATNAAKYGALSVEEGRLRISWRVFEGAQGERRFLLEWVERGGPPVKPPKETSFGTIVTQRLLSGATAGEVEADYRPEGLVWRLTAPLSRIVA